MKPSILIVVAFLLFIGFNTVVVAQSYDVFGDILEQNEKMLDKEVQPVLKAFSSITGQGFFTSANLHGMGGFEIGVHGVGAIIPTEDQLKVFNDIDMVGLPMIHASLGLPGNLELTARAFSYKTGDPVEGNITILGGGIKYGLVQLPALPKISVLFGYHALIPPEEFQFNTVRTLSFKGIISHNFLIFSLYGGAGIDMTKFEINVPKDQIPTSKKILYPDGFAKDYDGSYFQGAVGLVISPIPFFRVNAAYNFGAYNGVDLGLAFSFR